MIATLEGYDIEDQVFTAEAVGQRASMPDITPLKVVFVGLILDGSIPILWMVS